jgi:hypothetical protein
MKGKRVENKELEPIGFSQPSAKKKIKRIALALTKSTFQRRRHEYSTNMEVK